MVTFPVSKEILLCAFAKATESISVKAMVYLVIGSKNNFNFPIRTF